MKPIPGFPGYSISEDGTITNPKGKILTRRDAWEGYPRARLKHESGKFVNRKIHSLVARAYLGEGKEVRHLDNDRSNFHLHNLEWGDRFSNAKDRLDRGSYHLPTKLVDGKSLLVVGDKLYDPENKTFHEDVKVASKLYPKAHEALFNSFHPYELIRSEKRNIRRNFIHKRLLDLTSQGNKSALDLLKEHESKIIGHPVDRLHSILNYTGFVKKAEWTSKENANKHADKHAKSMGLSKEEYIESAKKALHGKLSLISVKRDTHKTRDTNGNILVHKNKKVITFYPGSNTPVKAEDSSYSKVAYLHKAKKHIHRIGSMIGDTDRQYDAASTYLQVRDKKNASLQQIPPQPSNRS